MKLYTEEQVRELLSDHINEEWINKHISSITPIELPSDEEIKSIMFRYNINDFGQMSAFQVGAKWVIDKIKTQRL